MYLKESNEAQLLTNSDKKNEEWDMVPATQGSEWWLLLQPIIQRRPVIYR